MSLSSTSTDFINWSYLFKGNYRKGVFRCKEIMATPEQATALCSNAGAMALILSHDPDDPDRNSEELRNLILGSSYVDTAVETWLPLVFEGKTAEECTSDKTTVTAIMAGSTTAPVIAASSKYLARSLCTIAGYEGTCPDSMDALFADSSATTAVVGNQTCATYIASSEQALAKVEASDTATNAVIEGWTNDLAPQTTIWNASTVIQGKSITDSNVDTLLASSTKRAALKSNVSFAQKVASKYSSSFSSASWATIINIAEVAAAQPSCFSSYVSKTHTVAITSNGTHTFRVAGVGADSGSGFTFVCDDLVGTHNMNSSNTASDGWESSAMRSYLSGTLLPLFPSELKSAIKAVSKKNTSGYGAATTSDKLWIPSQTEVGLTSGSAEGARYSIFTSDSTRIRKHSGSAYYWWLRSSFSSTYFRYVDTDGLLNYGDAVSALGICPCFCI